MTVRVGFVGVGYMGQMAHLHSFLHVADCEVAAIAELRPQLAQAVAQTYGIPRVYSNHRELLHDASIQAVICSQPYHRNAILGREILAAGKALLTEKPMAARLDDAQGLVEEAERQGVVYAVGFMKRHDPGVQEAKRIITELGQTGALGALCTIDSTCFLGDWMQNPGQPLATQEAMPADESLPRYPDFLPRERQADYDHFLNIYSHNVNLLHYLRPEPEMVCESVLRRGQSYLVSLHSGETVISLRGAPSRSHRWEEETVFIYERGRVTIQSSAPMNRQAVARVSVYREEDGLMGENELFPPIEWAFLRQAKAFVAAASGDGSLSTAGRSCLADVKLMEDIFRKMGE